MDGRTDSGGTSPPEISRLTREQGHALRNIFSIISANAEMINEELTGISNEVDRRLERIIKACRRGEDLVQGIRDMAGSTLAPRFAGTVPARPTARILVVDDEEDIVEVISRFLVREHFEVHGLTDGRVALEMMRSDPHAFDLLVTDSDMPFLSGDTLCQAVQEMRPDFPVIMITGLDRHDPVHLKCLARQGELLLKPLNRNELLATVHTLLNR